MNICILSVRQVQVHTMLESDILSDCLARQHLHSSASSHHGNSSPLPSLDDFTGMHRWNGSKSKWKSAFSLQHLSLEMSENKEKGNCPNTWAAVSFIFSHGLICSFSSPSSAIPSMIAHHASVYLVQLPGTDCGQVGPLPARPSASPNRFSSQALFLSLSMAEPGSRSCQVHWGSVGKREGRVSRRAVHVYYFRLLAVLPRRLWGKSLKRHTTSYVYSGWNKHVSV